MGGCPHSSASLFPCTGGFSGVTTYTVSQGRPRLSPAAHPGALAFDVHPSCSPLPALPPFPAAAVDWGHRPGMHLPSEYPLVCYRGAWCGHLGPVRARP